MTPQTSPLRIIFYLCNLIFTTYYPVLHCHWMDPPLVRNGHNKVGLTGHQDRVERMQDHREEHGIQLTLVGDGPLKHWKGDMVIYIQVHWGTALLGCYTGMRLPVSMWTITDWEDGWYRNGDFPVPSKRIQTGSRSASTPGHIQLVTYWLPAGTCHSLLSTRSPYIFVTIYTQS
jgi:hypothetical protein